MTRARGLAMANAARTRRDDPEHRVHVRAVAEVRASFVRRGIWSGRKEDACPMFHAMNEGKCSRGEAEKRRALGVASGVPDLVFATPIRVERYSYDLGRDVTEASYPGAALEIKAPGGKPSPLQLGWLAHFRACGFATAVTAGHRETALQLARWGLIEREAADRWIAWAERCDPTAL